MFIFYGGLPFSPLISQTSFTAIISKQVRIPSHCNGARNICLLRLFPNQKSFQTDIFGMLAW